MKVHSLVAMGIHYTQLREGARMTLTGFCCTERIIPSRHWIYENGRGRCFRATL